MGHVDIVEPGKADCIKVIEVNMEVNGQYETTLLMAQISEQ